MINIVPWTDRRLTIRSCKKILAMWPNEDIKLINVGREYGGDYKERKWAEKLARFFILRGRKVYVEMTEATAMKNLEIFADMGCHIIFVWYGMKRENFVASFYIVGVARELLNKFDKLHVTVRYIPVKLKTEKRPEPVDVETSLGLLLRLAKEEPRFHMEFGFPIPWSGEMIGILMETGLIYLDTNDKNRLCKVHQCGSITILPNTNIYACQYQPQKERKKLFGNADRDKYVIGTLRRGMIREISPCNRCAIPRHYPRGGE
jgi:hypothetical protein